MTMKHKRDKQTLTRTCTARYDISDNQHIVNIGLARALAMWNQLVRRGTHWYIQLARICGPELASRATRYPGRFTLDKMLRPYILADRCASGVLIEYDAAWQAFFGNRKNGNEDAKPPRERKWKQSSLFFEVGRNAKPAGQWMYRLTVLGQRDKVRHVTVKLRTRPNMRMQHVKTLRLFPNNKAFMTYEVVPSSAPGARMAAIDLGIINQAVLAFDDGSSVLYSGRGYLAMDQLTNKRIAACKPKNWRKEKPEEEHPKYSEKRWCYDRKRKNIRRLACHNLTTDIIRRCKDAQVGTLIIGDLTGIRENKDWGAKGNQKLHAWPYVIIRDMLTYKAEKEGIELKRISERGTSSHCHVCGERGVREPRGVFSCRRCGKQINSDVNGAFGILNKVSPVAVKAIGVEADLPGLPSPEMGTGKDRLAQIGPACVAKYDLRNWTIYQRPIAASKAKVL